VLSVTTDLSVLDAIKKGYASDKYCAKLTKSSTLGTVCVNDLWYVGNHLIIPCISNIHENLFQLAHDSLSYFGADKSYTILHDAYYWLNMHCDLEKAYIPSCQDFQRNKSHTTKAPGPLHPLPVPDARFLQ